MDIINFKISKNIFDVLILSINFNGYCDDLIYLFDYYFEKEIIRFGDFFSIHTKIYEETYRKCFRCKREIKLSDYLISNLDKLNDNILLKYWNNNRIQFFCCKCFYNMGGRKYE